MSTDTRTTPKENRPPTAAENWLDACSRTRTDHPKYGVIVMNQFYSHGGDKVADLTDKGVKIGRRWQFKDGSFCDFYLEGTGKAFTGIDEHYKRDIITL